MVFEQWWNRNKRRIVGPTPSAAREREAREFARAGWNAMARQTLRFMDKTQREDGIVAALEETRAYLAP
jgi:hypothetical protein